MKIKLFKIMAIAVTVTLLVSLMIGGLASPAAAKDLKWSKQGPPPPGDDGGYFWSTEIGGFYFLDMAIDGTLYAGVWMDEDDDTSWDSGEDYIMRSSDEGRSWDETKYKGGPIVDIAFSPEDADTFWVADEGQVYRTTNAGDKFVGMTTTTDLGTIDEINTLSVGYYNDEPYLYFGGTDTAGSLLGEDVFMLDPGLGSYWTRQDAPTDVSGGEIYEVFCSPDFNDVADPLVMVVGYDGTDTNVYYRYGSGDWDDETPLELIDNDDVGLARIAVPDDFDSDLKADEMQFFVAIVDDWGPGVTDECGAYWVVSNTYSERVFKDAHAASIDIAGEAGSGTVMVGGADGKVYYNENFGDGKWDDANPAGDGFTFVLLAQDYLESSMSWALVNGYNQSLTMSTDNKGYPAISLIDDGWDWITDFAVTEEGNLFVGTWSNEYWSGLWRWDGSNWERIVATDSGKVVDLVAFSPDGALFYADRGNMEIFRSTNDGASFKMQKGNPASFITAWLILDDSTIMVGSEDGVQKTTNNGLTWGPVSDFGHVTDLAKSPDYDADETILAGTMNTTTWDGAVWMSTNGGKDWKEKKDYSGYWHTEVAFDPGFADNGIFYAAGANWEIGGSDGIIIDRNKDGDWDTIFDSADQGFGSFDIYETRPSGLIFSPDGTLYVSADGYEGVFRSLNPTAPPPDVEFEKVDDRYLDDALAGLQVTEGSNVLWGSTIWGKDIFTYTDTLTGSVTLVAPSDGSSSNRVDAANLSWNAMEGAKKYQLVIGDDPGFKAWTDDENDELEVTSYTYTGLEAGKTYYWKVRATGPLLSRWSDTWEFTTDLGAAEWNPFVGGVPEAPANGATNVPLQPSFAWNAADWATGYEFVLATDAAFSDAIVSKTGANALTTTVYMSEQELAYSTTYYWKVRAVSKTSGSEWATAVFTTEGEPAAAPTAPPVVTPTPVDTSTPAYIWVIIGIGAALIIAVIILIVRTRRVA